MWWGGASKEKLPQGFELCDGGWSDSLKRNRPYLIERFVRGAPADAKSPDDLGGKEDDGKHGIDFYPLPDLVHEIAPHTHGTSSLYGAWGRRSAQGQDARIYQQELRGRGREELAWGRTMLFGSLTIHLQNPMELQSSAKPTHLRKCIRQSPLPIR